MKIRLSAPLQKESYVDGEGIRMVIWNQGCLCNCPGCHNPQTHDLAAGFLYDIEELKKEILLNKNNHKGITLSGGDPFLQPLENIELAKYAHALGLNVWAYCGLTFEQLIKDENKKALLENCDVLVDGPFILNQRDIRLAFRGSSNQRLVAVQESLRKGTVQLYETNNSRDDKGVWN